MCARHEPRIPFGGDFVSRDNVTADDNKSSRIMGDHSRTIRHGYPRPRRMVGPALDNIHATVGSITWNPHMFGFILSVFIPHRTILRFFICDMGAIS